MRRIENVNPSAPPQTGVLQQRDANLLVVPAHQWRRHLLGSRLGFGGIHRLLDSPARGALTYLDRHTGLRGRKQRRLAQSACSAIWTKSLRTTSPLKSLSSEVPRDDKPCAGSITSTLYPKAPNTRAERRT